MKLPDWLPRLTARDEKLRAAHGLTAKRDGWYKSIDGKTRYICKPCPAADVAAMLPARVAAIRARGIALSTAAAAPVQTTPGTLTIEQLVETYTAWLYQRLTSGRPKKLARRTYDDNVIVLERFLEVCGSSKPADAVGPADFSAFARRYFGGGRAPTSIRREVIYLEAFANWAAPGSRKAGLLVRPWQYGPDFAKPSDDQITTSAADSDKAYTADQMRSAFLAVRRNPLLRAVGYVAFFAAMQPKDLGLLPEALVDLEDGLIRFPRGKTGVGRMAYLPPAAVLAVRAYLAVRPAAADVSGEHLMFRTPGGRPCYREAIGEDAKARTDYLSRVWSAVTGLPLSGLRSTFATHADDWPDQRAVDVVLGHKAGGASRSIRSRNYAKRVDPERVRRLARAVWPLAFGRKVREG